MPVTLLRVWRPEGYADIEAAIGAITEAADLDFKRQLSKPTDIAKDIAAMSIQGGVIAYGIDEAAQTAIASAITPIPLHQVPEKIQNIVDTAIWPPPAIEIQVFTKQQGDADGVVLVTVHASLLAPAREARMPDKNGVLLSAPGSKKTASGTSCRRPGTVVPVVVVEYARLSLAAARLQAP